ncbi:MAG: phasin family protein [Glaciecola sp.]|nr:phasin family protein [Glaciecola sp.]
MFGKFSEQVKKSSQPVSSLVALNAKRLEALSQMQTEFFTGFMADSLKYVESMSVQTEVKGVIAAQTSYAEALKDRIAHASKDTYGAMNEIREEYTDLLKTSLDDSAANVPSAFKTAADAVAPSKPEATAPKTAEKPASKKAAAKPVAKPAAKAKPAVKAASKPAAKPAVQAESKPVAKPIAKPAVKAEAKPVATPAATTVSSTPANAEAKKL